MADARRPEENFGVDLKDITAKFDEAIDTLRKQSELWQERGRKDRYQQLQRSIKRLDSLRIQAKAFCGGGEFMFPDQTDTESTT